jgi:hypothetical protein
VDRKDFDRMRQWMKLIESISHDYLYHGTSHAGLLLIASGDMMLATSDNVNANGVSFTRNFDKAKVFAERAVGNAFAHGYDADPSDHEMLPFLAERQADGDDGVVMVFDRSSLDQAHDIQAIDPGVDWGMGVDDEEEERLVSDADEVNDMMRHLVGIVIVSPARYATFKHFVLRHNKSYTKAFAAIERMIR